MRALYSFPHPIGKPGIGTIAFHQVQGLIHRGIDVLLMCTSLARTPDSVAAVEETLAVRGRRIPHRVIGVARAYRHHDARVARALRRLKVGVDLVHCWPHASIATCTAARALGIPSVREVPNTHTGYAFDAVTREIDKLGLTPIAGHSHTFDPNGLAREETEYRLADILLVPSEFAKKTFLERGVPAEKLWLHQYGFDPTRFHPPRDAIDRVDGGLTALFVGSCEPRKGLHHALQAWVASGAAGTGRFVICGSFVPGYREALASWLEHPSVEIRGFVDDPGTLMRQSDVFVFPSIEEGSALVTYEAQASGCVPVVSDAAGARLEHMREGLVHPAGDLETLTAHLRRLNEDRAFLSELRRAAIAARDQLTWQRAAEELASIYTSVCEKAEAPAAFNGSWASAARSGADATE
jgi:glycosyltransferase involved in cell wall biosynthesis